jgi:hypothetical protein
VFLEKNICPQFKNAIAYYIAGVVVVNSKAVGLVVGAMPTIVIYNVSVVKNLQGHE